MRASCTKEGRFAASLGTTQAIRDYGTQMVKDQDMLLGKLQTLAASKNITLPNAISEKKSKQLEKLSKLTGKPFDRKFLKMIKADHKRDIKRFTKATYFEDGDTRIFAETNLKLIEQHLVQAQALAKCSNRRMVPETKSCKRLKNENPAKRAGFFIENGIANRSCSLSRFFAFLSSSVPDDKPVIGSAAASRLAANA
jgi:predicted outer membrane protein